DKDENNVAFPDAFGIVSFLVTEPPEVLFYCCNPIPRSTSEDPVCLPMLVLILGLASIGFLEVAQRSLSQHGNASFLGISSKLSNFLEYLLRGCLFSIQV